MPILGMNIPDKLIADTKVALLQRILASSKLSEVKEGRLQLTRQPYTGDYVLKTWTAIDGYVRIANFGMLPLPGCRAICVFHHSLVEPEFRGKGLGKELLRIRTEAAKDVGYKLLLATVRRENYIERNMLLKAGWERNTFFNGAFGHEIDTFTRTL